MHARTSDLDSPKDHRSRDIRIGPFVFAPGLRQRPGDPWAHRRGEPRVFALLWTVFLISSTALTVFSERAISGSMLTQHRYASVVLSQMVAVGIVLLWPAFRFSQAPPERPVRATAADLAVIALPLGPLALPLPLLAGWPAWPVAAFTITLLAWACLTGGVLAVAVRAQSPGDRTAAMGAWSAALIGLPMVALVVGSLSGTGALWEVLAGLSPFVAMSALLSASPGHAPDPTLDDLLLAAGPPLGLAALAWTLAGAVPARLHRN